MCLPVLIKNPDRLLEKDVYKGIEYNIIHTNMGFRCGYIKLLPDHPWYGKDYVDLQWLEVHGGLTFSEFDSSCEEETQPVGWWLGFDCAHFCDARDMTLPGSHHNPSFQSTLRVLEKLGGVVRDTDYVREQCFGLIDQAIELQNL